MVKVVEVERKEMTDYKGYGGVRTKETLNNLVGQGITKKSSPPLGRRALGKGRAGQALGVCMGLGEGEKWPTCRGGTGATS